MKFLLVLAVVGVVLWLLRARSRGDGAAAARRDAPSAVRPPQAMVACAHCGLHLPAADAVLEGSRVYCCDAHRQRGPRAADAG